MTHRGLVTEGEDCEALVGSQPQVSKFPTRSVTAGCLFLFLSLSLYLSSGAPRHAESATLEIINAATKWTKFGEVPLSFELSGVECRLNKALNGQYDYQFQTADGRPVYKRTDEAGDHIYLFYDKECDGDRGGKSNMWGEFVLRYNPGQLSKTALSDVDRDHKCTSAAYTAYGSQGPTDRSRPYYHGKAGALPGKSVKWHVYCGPSTGLTIQTLRLSGHFAAPELKAKGAWQYVTTVKQGETRTESYGFDVSNSKGGAWDAGGEISGPRCQHLAPRLLTETALTARVLELAAAQLRAPSPRLVCWALLLFGRLTNWQLLDARRLLERALPHFAEGAGALLCGPAARDAEVCRALAEALISLQKAAGQSLHGALRFAGNAAGLDWEQLLAELGDPLLTEESLAASLTATAEQWQAEELRYA
ncbi:unnamed protein product [Effrenium voratum]|uniref:Uncharacterized protein n=1 Tax=Effrenium voratum TaxID=2562239 RepID=A0AA36JCP4_9DINO|nr:unnamed protein product [Effrenium voratum]